MNIHFGWISALANSQNIIPLAIILVAMFSLTVSMFLFFRSKKWV